MEREQILSEIRRLAAENNGVAPGKKAFKDATGVTESHWTGRYWARWGDAVAEAGLLPNEMQSRIHSDEALVESLAQVTSELGHFPTVAELRLCCRKLGTPSHNTFARLGTKGQRIELVREFVQHHPAYDDVAPLLPPPEPSESNVETRSSDIEVGFVYLARSGRFHKIGQTQHLGRRSYELQLQLPERLELIHSSEPTTRSE